MRANLSLKLQKKPFYGINGIIFPNKNQHLQHVIAKENTSEHGYCNVFACKALVQVNLPPIDAAVNAYRNRSSKYLLWIKLVDKKVNAPDTDMWYLQQSFVRFQYNFGRQLQE